MKARLLRHPNAPVFALVDPEAVAGRHVLYHAGSIRTAFENTVERAGWGACNQDFNEADDAARLHMLFVQFHQFVLLYGLDPQAVHALS